MSIRERELGLEIYERYIQSALFKFNPERAHTIALASLKVIGSSNEIMTRARREFAFEDSRLNVDLWGTIFENPIGLAAGFCKDFNPGVIRGLGVLDLGHTEGGGITEPQRDGNEGERVWRSIEESAAVNWMGLNNPGVVGAEQNLRELREDCLMPLIVNIAGSVEDETLGDPVEVFRRLYPYADIFDFNISCPNHEGFRQKQEGGFANLVGRIEEARVELEVTHGFKPVLFKVSPDAPWPQLDEMLGIAVEHGFDGVVAVNTTQERDGLDQNSPLRGREGGLSGRPLKERAIEVVAYIRRQHPNLPIIGVGGIENADDAWKMMKAGANLVQVLTGMIFHPHGPYMIKEIKQGLVEFMESEGVSNIQEIVGIDTN